MPLSLIPSANFATSDEVGSWMKLKDGLAVSILSITDSQKHEKKKLEGNLGKHFYNYKPGISKNFYSKISRPKIIK